MVTKKLTRANLRGEQQLDIYCKLARIAKHQYGPDDHRCFCYGMYADMSDDIHEKCLKCKAYVGNAEPPEEG